MIQVHSNKFEASRDRTHIDNSHLVFLTENVVLNDMDLALFCE
jgi:hypothetical protein